jgi:hypothetical protein
MFIDLRCATCDDDSKFENIVNPGTTEAAKHYQVRFMQPIEIMQDFMTPEQLIGFLRGNIIKYVLRIGNKGSDREDAGKAYQYAEWLCQAMDGKKIVPGGKS